MNSIRNETLNYIVESRQGKGSIHLLEHMLLGGWTSIFGFIVYVMVGAMIVEQLRQSFFIGILLGIFLFIISPFLVGLLGVGFYKAYVALRGLSRSHKKIMDGLHRDILATRLIGNEYESTPKVDITDIAESKLYKVPIFIWHNNGEKIYIAPHLIHNVSWAKPLIVYHQLGYATFVANA